MKLALLISMLAVGGILARTVRVTVEGTLKCTRPFQHFIATYELDGLYHALIGKNIDKGNSSTHNYNVSGTANDWWPEQYVEPVMILWHNCDAPRTNQCFCKELGDIWQDLHVKVDLNLDHYDYYSSDFKPCLGVVGCGTVMGGATVFRYP